ncbi:MAG: InlB B-repeat-containing protein [Candidatus Borkfalkiaceae bacterium]|nr:InlB B-repeat-containing protein [Christensenellaceae bacterium]
MKKIAKVAVIVLLGLFLISGLTACKAKYELSFNTDSEVSIQSVKVAEGEEYILPVPERSGYSFEGWFTDEKFTGDAVVKISPKADTSFYAKWAKLYTLTLDTDNGVLAEKTFSLKAGENISEFLKDKTPVKENVIFGAWFNGSKVVTDKTVMPSADLTLTAKYKAEYTVEIFRQKVDSDDYEKETITDYAFIGENLTVSDDYEGFNEIYNDNSITTKIISENAGENIFRRYFERKRMLVSFRSGIENEETVNTFEYKYGEKITLSDDMFSREGYWLIGWKDGEDGTVYTAGRTIFNDDKVLPDEITVKSNNFYTAVWQKGYCDVFNSDDYVYIFNNEPESIYLSRGGVYFKGYYSSELNEFFFELENEDIVLSGKINEDGSFAYKAPRRSEKTRYLYSVKDGRSENVMLLFDEYNGIEYKDGNDSSYGKYSLNDNGQYVATFESGSLQGKTLVMVFDEIEEENAETGKTEQVSVFRVRNEDEYKIGKLFRGLIKDGNLYSYKDGYYTLTFSGFGTVAYSQVINGISKTDYYYCSIENNRITLTDVDENVIGIAEMLDIGTTKCYMFYNGNLDNTFTAESGATLKLDGVYKAEYTDGTSTINGYYETETSVFGGVIVTVLSGDQTYKFLLKQREDSSAGGIIGEEGNNSEIKIEYDLALKGKRYKEYYYKSADGALYTPLIVIDDGETGKASLYGYTDSGKHVFVSSGNYTYDQKTGRTVYRAESFASSENLQSVTDIPFDITKVQSAECYFGTATIGSVSLNVSYWYSYSTKTDTVELGEKYFSSDEKEILTVISDLAVYATENKYLYGTASVKEKVLTLYTGANNSEKTIFELKDDKSFIKLVNEPYRAFKYNSDGKMDESEYIVVNGTGTGVYYSKANGEINGSFAETTRTTEFGAKIYKFTSNDGRFVFEFIRLSTTTDNLFAVSENSEDNTYHAVSGTLILDGFGYYAQFTDADNKVYGGRYFRVNENCVKMNVDGITRFFDFIGNNFTIKGDEYGVYLNTDNGVSLYDKFYELDGYSVIKTFTLNADGSRNYVGEGTYSRNNDSITFTLKNGNTDIKGEFALGDNKYIYNEETYGELIILHEEIKRTFVNTEDWSILILDNAGGAIKIDNDGNKRTGKYVLITENLLYYQDADENNSCIYRYNTSDGWANPVKFSEKAYYTEKLDSLLFSQSGFAIFNGKDYCYYDVDKGGNVIVYKKDDTSGTAGKYGFSVENFGKFEKTVTYNNNVYYENSGWSIKFNRLEDGKNDYPVTLVSGSSSKFPLETLTFAPNGNTEFKVTGAVRICGKNYSAVIRREVDENNDTKLYLVVGTYVFDIEISYKGESSGTSLSTYKITAMKGVVSAMAYKYLDNYYKAYVNYGAGYASNYKNEIGTISVNYVYDINGEVESSYVSAEFGEGSGFYDSLGNILTVENVSFEYDSEKSLYLIRIKGQDGYDYSLVFGFMKHSAYRNTFGYYVYYLSRTETLIDENGYKVETERVIVSDNENISAGSIRNIKLYKNGTEIPYSGAIISGDRSTIRFISRTLTDGKVTSSIYYNIAYTLNSDTEIGDNKNILATYKAVVVTENVMIVAYTEDGEIFFEADGDGNVVLLTINDKVYLVTETNYDVDADTYVIKAGGKKYSFKLSNDKTVISEFTELND